jgi:hypothetical protein
LRWFERVGAVVLGLGAAGSGGYAVFATSNQAGAAALVVVGATFLLIGVQGTRLIRLGGGGNSIEMAQYRAAVRVIERAKREETADVAEGMVEAAAIISPAVVPSPRVEVRKYEDELHRALERAGVMVQREPVVAGGRVVDFVVETGGGGRAVVEAKARRYGALTMRDVDEMINQVNTISGGRNHDAGLLIVTNAPLSGEVQEFNSRRSPAERPPVEVISWNDERDDGLLGRALARVAR